MTLSFSGRGAAALALLLAACAPAPVEAPPERAVEGFQWLLGCWQSRDGVVERWEQPEGLSVIGTTLMPQADGTQIEEALRIEQQEGEEIVLSAQIGTQGAMAFTLTERDEGAAIFENADNPALKRLAYRRTDDVLTITFYPSLEEGERGWQSRLTPCAGY